MHIIYLVVIVVFIPVINLDATNCKNEKRCKISVIKNMKAADCYYKDMRNFPQCIVSNVEIIDVGSNRIRKTTRTELSIYSDLKLLYFFDNLLTSLDEDTFDDLTSLTTLDISTNAITQLPSSIFKLPSLSVLYLDNNPNMNVPEAVEQAKPIVAPLVRVEMAYINTEKPRPLPDFGILPTLIRYNISGNRISDLQTRHFAGLCSLQYLDTANVTVNFADVCECWVVNNWLKERKVAFKLFPCKIMEDECLYRVLNDDDAETYRSCKIQLEEINKKQLLVKIGIPILVIIAIVTIIGLYVVYRKRKRPKTPQKNVMSLQNNDRLLM